jgi:hypothetical protein
LSCVCNRHKNAGGASTQFDVTSTGEGIRSGESASESEDEIACADSISREIEEMNKFEEGDLDGKDAHNYDNEHNI